MLKKFFSSTSGQIIILFFLCLTLVVLWFSGGNMYAGGEEGLFYYNLTKYLSLSSYSWYEVGTGFQLFTLLPKLPFYSVLEFLYRNGIGTVLLQALTFLFLMFIGCLSVFTLIKETVTNELKKFGKFVPLMSGTFYLLNPYSMSQIWGRGIYSQFFAFALVPAFLLLFVKGINHKNFLYGLLALFISLLFSSVYTFPGNVLMLWLVVCLYLLFYIRANLKNKKNIIFSVTFFLLTFIGWVLTNLFWIMPYFVGSNLQYAGFINTEANISSLQGVSRAFSFPVLIRLMQSSYFYHFYGTLYTTFLFQLISFVIPVTSLFSLPKFKTLKLFGFYKIVFLVGLFINLGSNFPSGWFFELLFRAFPILQMFRNPYEKLGLILVMAYVPFFTIGVVELSNRISYRFKSVKVGNSFMILIMVLVTVVFAWPMWFRLFAGGFWANPWIEVPNYYKEADQWLINQNSSLRLLQLPLNPGEGVRFSWQHNYSGIDPSEILFNNSSIARNVTINQARVYYNVLLERFGLSSSTLKLDSELSDAEFRSRTLTQELEKLGVGYIVLHHDIDTAYSGMKNIEETIRAFSKETAIKKIKTFGELDIYQIGNPQDRSIIFSPAQALKFTKINPTYYNVFVKNSEKPFELYFLQFYDNGWEAYINGVRLENHKKAYSYANLWHVDTKGDYTIVIKYKPQEVVEKGNKISVVSTIILGLLSGLFLLRKRIQYEK